MKEEALSILSLFVLSISAETWFTAVPKPGGGFVLKSGRETKIGACWGFFSDEVEKIGWGRLSLTSNEAMSDESQVAGCGWLEGALTWERIWQTKTNWFAAEFGGNPPEVLMKWQEEHRAWVAQSVNGSSEPFWKALGLVHAQVRAMADAISEFAPASKRVTFSELMVLNSEGDNGDILNSIDPGRRKKTAEMTAAELWRDLAERGHCSAIVRLTPDLSDLFVAHNTWGEFQAMLRIVKSYHFPLHGVRSRGCLFPGYPGILVSNDDIYSLEDTRLAVTETTNDVINDSLWSLVTPKSALYWERVLIANRLASDAKSWTEIFSIAQSGTYSNQWMVVDFRKFRPKQQIQADTFWVLELRPGAVHAEDCSHYLRSGGFWPSFNRPFFDDMYKDLGYAEATEKFGSMFSYDANPRANLFRRDAGSIGDIESLKKFITSNNYKTDPLSEGYAGNAISARFDLQGGPSPGSPWDSWWKLGLHGGTDAKIIAASTTLDTKLSMTAVCGPTITPSCPAFEWAGRWSNYSHIGLPQKYDFPWVVFSNTV